MLTQIQKDQLAAYFATQPVDVVYLFGSQATGRVRTGSDIDVGVLFKEGVSQSDRFDLKLKFMSRVGIITGFPDKVDVVNIEQAPLPLAYEIVFPKEVIYSKNRDRMVELERDIVRRYLDIRPSLNMIARRQLQLLAERGFADG